MRICTITCSINSKSFTSTFFVKRGTPEYILADEAYRIALLFAETQAVIALGCHYTAHQFAQFLKGLDYDYTVKEGK